MPDIRRTYRTDLAVRLEDRADRADRAGDEVERILVLRALAEVLRSIETLMIERRGSERGG